MASLDYVAQNGAVSDGKIEEVPPEDDEAYDLKWRGDPATTFSDWTIEIVTKAERTEPELVTTYHVHKFVLGYGSRRSEYFARLFLGKNFQEAESSMSRIELDPLAADAFPHLLDFVYEPNRALTVNTSTAVPLHYLGDYFEMPRLRWEAQQFCKNDLSIENFATYYQHSVTFVDDVVHRLVADLLGKNLKLLPNKLDIVEFSEPKLWQQVAKSIDTQDESTCRKLSSFICKFCTHHRSTLNSLTFQNLTKSDVMPSVSANAAMELCELDDEFNQRQNDASICDEEVTGMTGLQHRCATAMSRDLDRLQKAFSKGKALQRLQQRQPQFLVDLLMKSLFNANKTIHDYTKDLEATKAELEETKTAMLATKEALEKKTKILESFAPIPYNELNGVQRTAYTVNVPQELREANPTLANQPCLQYVTSFGIHLLSLGMGGNHGYPVFYYKHAQVTDSGR